MKVFGKNTSLTREEVFKKAMQSFEDKFGLHLKGEASDCCMTFSNEIGFVTVEIAEHEGAREVTVRTREWESQSQEFLAHL